VSILPAGGVEFQTTVPVAIVGAGACGLTAALAASDAGAEVLVLERDALPQGSTALSSGMIPACGTKAQAAQGVEDPVAVMAADIMAKAHGQADPAIVETVCRESGPAIDWLTETHGVELTLVGGFLYPGHSALRMHAPVSRQGVDLIGALTRAAELAPDNSLYLNGAGRIASTLGRYDVAIEYYNKALAIDLETYGPDHPKVAALWNNLGIAWKAKGKYDKAIKYLDKALASDLKTYGLDHPKVAISWNNLGSAWKNKSDYRKAREYFSKALAVFQKAGLEHKVRVVEKHIRDLPPKK
jgi:tetratricopeptide (TPR) repeat protein